MPLPISFNGSTTSHFGSDRKNIETCCKAISAERRIAKMLYQYWQMPTVKLISTLKFDLCVNIQQKVISRLADKG